MRYFGLLHDVTWWVTKPPQIDGEKKDVPKKSYGAVQLKRRMWKNYLFVNLDNQAAPFKIAIA